MATNPTVEGDATALYISKLLNRSELRLQDLLTVSPSEEILSMPMNTHLQRLLKAGVKYNGFIKTVAQNKKAHHDYLLKNLLRQALSFAEQR